MSHSIKEINSVRIHGFNNEHAHVPIPLPLSQEDTLKNSLRPVFEELIENPLFKQTFVNQLGCGADEIPLNIAFTEKTITVINKKTQASSTFTIDQMPSHEPLNKIIIRIFEIANKTLYTKKDINQKTDKPSKLSEIATQKKDSSAVPLQSNTIPKELDLFDVTQLNTTSIPQKIPEEDPFQGLFMPTSDLDSNPSTKHFVSKEPLNSILKLYGSSPLVTHPPYLDFTEEDRRVKTKRPYLQDLFYDLDGNCPKKAEEEPKPREKIDIDAFEYLSSLERTEKNQSI